MTSYRNKRRSKEIRSNQYTRPKATDILMSSVLLVSWNASKYYPARSVVINSNKGQIGSLYSVRFHVISIGQMVNFIKKRATYIFMTAKDFLITKSLLEVRNQPLHLSNNQYITPFLPVTLLTLVLDILSSFQRKSSEVFAL